MTPALLFNGGAADVEALTQSRALHYGDGVFRTMLVWQGECRDWDDQYARLASDAARLSLDVPDTALLHAEAQSLVQHQTRAVLKILLWRRATGRGYATSTSQADRLLIASAAPRYAAECWQAGVAVFRSPIQLSTQMQLAGVKHLNRLEQVLASRDWPAQMHEALMCDAQGQVVCGTRSNLFWSREGRLYTPPLDACGVSGAMRARVLAACAGLGIVATESNTDWAGLISADEGFLSNSLIGIWPLRALDAQIKPAPGALTARLIAALDHPRLC